MTLRFTNQALVLAILSCAATICASPAGADAVDQSVTSAAVEIGRSGPQARKAQSDATTSAGNPVLAIPLSKLSMTRDRPIFSPSRRPPMVAAPPVMARQVEPAKPAEPENPPLVLVGTVAGEDSGIAVFVELASENTVRLRINESHQGWTLNSIVGREVTLLKGRKSSVLALAPPGGTSEPASSQASLEPPRRSPRR